MKTRYLFKVSFLLAVFLSGIAIQAQQMSGNQRFWEKSDFLGFDEVGDCTAETGDISSVFARSQGKTLLLRITFDDMVTRKDNAVVSDNFADRKISLHLKLTNQETRNLIIDELVDLAKLSQQNRNFTSLRTLDANLWEAEINLDRVIERGKIEFSLAIAVDGKIADYFLSDGGSVDAEGNCAFVHHGNQGITYTEVFYGSPGGQSGLDGSGFDEVLQVHEATDVPGNFHMSGTLMPAAAWHNPEFNTWLQSLAAEGTIEMMTSALGQHIMPFVQNNMNDWSVDIECDMVNFHYNYQPRTAWVPERVWLSPGAYPDAAVIDWLGDNWAQHGVWGVVLDDSPHLNGYDNRKIHWMNNGSGIELRVIPINNSFVGNMHYNANGAKNQIAGMGSNNICVYGTDWEVAAEMNEHDGTFFLDNYESVLWWCHDNYPGVNVWKTVDAMQNPNFNGTGAEITPGTYGLLGGPDGYGGSNNSWYTQWAGTPSHSDFHEPKWTYGYIWDDVRNNLMTAPDNNLAQLGWYILMVNLHETGWFDGGSIAGWEHRYSAHIKNANVYAEAARWADGQFADSLACYYSDIDHDGVDEVVIHNQKIFAVFESIGGKVNWLFYKDNLGSAYSVVGSDMAYWAETDGDNNDGSNNHVAALSDVYPYQQDAIYDINLIQSFGDTVVVEFSQWGVKKRIELVEDVNYLDVQYDFFGGDGFVKSGFTPGLMDILWSGKDHLQRMWGDYGSYCGHRNSASGATVALVMGNGGASHNTQFEGTLVLGDEIKGNNRFFTRLFAGYTSEPVGTKVTELNTLAAQNLDIFPPTLNATAYQVDNNTIELTFSEAVDFATAQTKTNYSLQGFSGSCTVSHVNRQTDWRKVQLTIMEYWQAGDEGQVVVANVEDLNGNAISGNNNAGLVIPSGTTPHTIAIDGTNDFDPETELMFQDDYILYITWDNNKLYLGFENLDLNGGGDLFVNIDTDQANGSGASGGSWGRVSYASQFEADYQVAIEGGGGSIQLNHFANGLWHYPANNNCESFEGWSGNGLTEIAIPWASMGNPDGVALSLHVSEEDNQNIIAAYPPQNPIGNHPTLSHVYALYAPFVASQMPVTGMVPAAAFVMPNQNPEIISYLPSAPSQQIMIGESLNFSLTVSDNENDLLSYSWLWDDANVGDSDIYTLNAVPGMEGIHVMKARVNDGVPGHIGDSVIWQVEITESDILLAAFSVDATHLCIGGTANFNDLSNGDVSAWTWTFEGGTPTSSSEQNPLVSFATAGSFNISLTVSDGSGSNTLTIEDYIIVNDNPTADAGEDVESCDDRVVPISASATNYSNLLWISNGDGVFSNAASLSSTYTPGSQDQINGSAEITLSAFPLSPCPAAASDMLTITFLKSPQITSQPLSQSVVEGSEVIFELEAEGSSPLSYTWFGSEGEITGANTYQLIIENVSSSDAGNYYATVTNDCGLATSQEATLSIQTLQSQSLLIPDGWSGISSWLIPQTTAVADLFDELVQNENLIVMQNYQYLFWPGQNINSIDLNGGWNYQSGYQIKVDGDQQITISGTAPADKSLSYPGAGWYLIPVLSECNVALADVFSEIPDDLLIVKEVAGTRLFWPGVFQNLYYLEPGKSYIAGFNSGVSFTYPDCEKNSSVSGEDPNKNSFFLNYADMKASPASHIFVINAKATSQLETNDRISIRSAVDGFQFASLKIVVPGKQIGFPLFADDESTSIKDGFVDGDVLKIEIIRAGETIETQIAFNPNYNNGIIVKNGLSEIESLEFKTGINNCPNESGFDFYPNPSKNILFFKNLETGTPIRIYSHQGKIVYDSQQIETSIDVSSLESGLYFVYIYQDGHPIIKKFVKQ